MATSSSQALELIKYILEKVLQQEGSNIGEYMKKNKGLLFDAAKLGNSNFLAELIHSHPNFILQLDEEKRNIFHVAFMHGHVTIFPLLKKLGFHEVFITKATDQYGNNLLHQVAMLTDGNYSTPVGIVSGAALQLQQQLKTFEEVENLIPPSDRETRNNEGLTPRELFTKHHKDLRKSGEKWMKNTTNSCILVATIIATMVYAVDFSVPGNYNDNGIPNQLKNVIFHNFASTDAIVLSFSSISILMFLSILTSSFKEKEFLKTLPLKFMFGFLTLLISMTAMMLSFSFSFFLAYNRDK